MAYTFQTVTKLPEAKLLMQNEYINTVTVAVIDSGHDDSLTHYQGRVVAHRNFWNGTGFGPSNSDVATNITRNIQAGDGEFYFSGDDRAGEGKIGRYAHGPWCSSILAADDNGIIQSGVAPHVNVMLLVGFGDVGDHGDYWSLCSAIYWAVDNGAQVLSISTGEHWPASNNTPSGNTPALAGYPSGIARTTLRARHEAALQYAHDNGVVVIGGTGNSFDNCDGTSYFPNDAYVPDRSAGASYWVPAEHDVNGLGGWDICVGGLCDNVATHTLTSTSQYYDEAWYDYAIDQVEYQAEFGSYHESGHAGSNYGSMCTVAVPSQDIEGSWGRNVSTGVEMSGVASGISGATPQAAGAVANLLAINPSLPLSTIASYINGTPYTDDIGSTLVPVGGRRINHEKGVEAAILSLFNIYSSPLPMQTGLLDFYTIDDFGNEGPIHSIRYYAPEGLVVARSGSSTPRLLIRKATTDEIVIINRANS